MSRSVAGSSSLVTKPHDLELTGRNISTALYDRLVSRARHWYWRDLLTLIAVTISAITDQLL